MNNLETHTKSERRPANVCLSLVINCYFDKDSTALDELLSLYGSYDPNLLDRIEIVIVDDGSPVGVVFDRVASMDCPLNMRLLRINEDIPWNEGGARNLGVIYSRSERVLMTDLDHFFDELALWNLLRVRLPRKVIYLMPRYRKNKLVRHHPNTFLLRRSRFIELFGYDEEFCGNYGCKDEAFSYWQAMMGTRFRWLPRQYAVRLRDFNVETETHDLVRDRAHNIQLLLERKKDLLQHGPVSGHSRKFLAFTWEVRSDTRRDFLTPTQNRTDAGPWWRFLLRARGRLRRLSSRNPYRAS